MRSLSWLDEHPPVLRWLHYEQTVNDRRVDRRVFTSIGDDANGVRPELRAASRAAWRLDVAWIPEGAARCIGPLDEALRSSLGLERRRGCVPLFVHPQGRGVHARALERWPLERTDIWVTPTSSERALVAARPGSSLPPCVIKVSLGAAIGGRRRVVREADIARAVLVGRVLDLVPAAYREALGLETFGDVAGVVVDDASPDRSGAPARPALGWLLRTLPPSVRERASATTLLPLFSLVSHDAARGSSWLLDAVRRSGADPIRWVEERVLLPYVQTLAYLMLEQGVVLEAHAQNVALGVDTHGELDGRVVLRDFTDASVHLGIRLAKRLPLPEPEAVVPRGAPASYVDEAVRPLAHLLARQRDRAALAVVRYGMQGVVWSLVDALSRGRPAIDARRLYRTYLELWQRATAAHLGFVPAIRRARGIDVDAAILEYLRSVDWSALGAGRRGAWPADARPLRWAPHRRRVGPHYRQVACGWGRLGVATDGTPVFFRPRARS